MRSHPTCVFGLLILVLLGASSGGATPDTAEHFNRSIHPASHAAPGPATRPRAARAFRESGCRALATRVLDGNERRRYAGGGARAPPLPYRLATLC